MNWGALLLAAAIAGNAVAGAPRSSTAKRAFRDTQACPATGELRGACPGYVIDHVVPLCAGGADDPSNMQWQELVASRAKDQLEFAQCRALRMK